MARVALEGDNLLDKLEELEEEGIDEDTLNKLANGTYSVDATGVIWKTGSPLLVKGTKPLPGAGTLIRKTSRFDIKSMLEVFDETVSPNDWRDIFTNWKEKAKTDHNAARSLFETRFGKAPTRIHLMTTDKDGNRLETAYSRTLERMEKLKIDPSPKPSPDDEIIISTVVDASVNSSDGKIRPKLKVRRKQVRDD